MTSDTRFVYIPADDDSTDDGYALIGHPDITIQVAPYMGAMGQYGVNEWLPDEEAMLHHGNFTTLKEAQAKALEVAAGME